MSDGSTLNTATVDPNVLKSKCPLSSDASGYPFTDYVGRPNMAPGSSWPDSTTHLQDGSREFYLCGGALCAFRVYFRPSDAPSDTPSVGDPLTRELYRFPLSEEDLVHLLGEPQRFSQYLHE
jgi:hypothetical protein